MKTNDNGKPVGLRLNEIDHLMKKGMCMRAVAAGNDRMVVMHGWILAYLEKNKDSVICQKDLEKAFRMPKSTVTGILQMMEKNGYITRAELKGDARSKQILLTEEGRRFHGEMKTYISETEEIAVRGIEPEAMAVFEEVLDKIRINLLNSNDKFTE